MLIFSHNLRSFGKAAKAFTLVELLVVTAVITIITLLLLLRQQAFDSATILRSVASNIAISVREAQVYGVSVLGSTNGGGTIQYAPAYGLYISDSVTNSYILFADFNGNGRYDPASAETLRVISLTHGYTISEVCVKLSSGTNRCTGSDDTALGTPSIHYAAIIFKRPNPDAVFTTALTTESYLSGWVQVASSAGTKRSILITSAGQISVQPLGTMP